MKKIKHLILILALIIIPAISFAQIQTATGGGGFDCNNNITVVSDLFGLATCYISAFIIPMLISLAVLIFMWGVVQFIANADNEEKRQKGRDFMVYGIIALFVMISVWGLVRVVSNTFGVKNVIPQLQSQ